MNAKELMIGDWVKVKEPDRYAGAQGTILSLTSLEGGYYAINIFDVNYGYLTKDVFNEDIEPIPLTTEILEKNGFDELMSEGEEVAAMFGRKPEPTGVWQYGFGRFDSVAYMPERSFLRIKFMEGCQTDIANIKYVHELQHALRLCGVEKEVEI